jgi:hypothetical protein
MKQLTLCFPPQTTTSSRTLAIPAVDGPHQLRVVLTIDGTCVGRRTTIRVNAQPLYLRDAELLLLLALAFRHSTNPSAWPTDRELGVPRRRRHVRWRLCTEMASALPNGFVLIERGRGSCRLNPKIILDIPNDRILEHPHPTVREMGFNLIGHRTAA